MVNLPINTGNTSVASQVALPSSGQVAAVPTAVESRLTVAASTSHPTPRQILEAVESVKRVADSLSSNSLQFSIDSDTGKTVVRITDIKTGDLIRQIPSKEMVEIAKSLNKLQGLLLHQKA